MKITTATPLSRRATRLVLVVALLLIALAGGPARAMAQTTQPASAGRGAEQRIADQENRKALDYWTPERMKKSTTLTPKVNGLGRTAGPPTDRGTAPVKIAPGKPAAEAQDVTPGGDDRVSALSTTTVSTNTASTASEGYWQYSNTANPNRQIGRLFYQQWDPVSRTWKNYNCSGAVVNSENKSVVWTAGHCVFQTFSNVWNRSYVFCPGYRAGSCPLGRWTPYSQTTTTQWQNAVCTATGSCNQAEFQYDLGALKMNMINGYRIANWVGSHGIQFNGAVYQYRYLFGYPLNKSSGEYMYFCTGNNSYMYGNLRVSCTAGGGASGGPWLSQINSAWGGVVHSVNSHGNGTYLGGPYQGNVALSMFNSVRY